MLAWGEGQNWVGGAATPGHIGSARSADATGRGRPGRTAPLSPHVSGDREQPCPPCAGPRLPGPSIPAHRYLSRRTVAHAPRPSTLVSPRRLAHCDLRIGARYFDHAATRRTGGNRGVGHGPSIGRRSRELSVSEIPLKGHEPSNHDPSASTRDASGGTYCLSLPRSPRSNERGDCLFGGRRRGAGTVEAFVLRLQPFGVDTMAGRPPRSTREKDRVEPPAIGASGELAIDPHDAEPEVGYLSPDFARRRVVVRRGTTPNGSVTGATRRLSPLG